MKFLCQLSLVFFLAFLATPTIISLVEEKSSLASFYELNEEEEGGSDISFDEIKLITQNETLQFTLPSFEFQLPRFALKDDALLCRYKASIFIPPPDFV